LGEAPGKGKAAGVEKLQRYGSYHPDFNRRLGNFTPSTANNFHCSRVADFHRRLRVSLTPEHITKLHYTVSEQEKQCECGEGAYT